MTTATTASALWVRYLGPRWRQLAVLGVLLVASTVAQVLGPQILQRFVDAVGAGEGMDRLLRWAGAFLVFAVLGQALFVLSELIGARLAWSATNDLRLDLLGHCLRLDVGFFDRRTPGELVERVDGDVGKLAGYFSRMFLLVAVNLLLMLGIAGVLFATDARVGLVFVGFLAVSVALLRRLAGRAIPDIAAQREAEAQQTGYLEERLAGLEDIAGAGAGESVMHGFWARAGAVFQTARRSAGVSVRWPATAELLSALGYALALGAGSALFLTGAISLGTVFALMAYMAMIRVPLFVITTQFKEIEEALAAMRRVRELFAERSALTSGDRPAPAGPPEVEFDGVSFGYRDGHTVLRDVSLRLPAGEHLGVVGRTGSGKSTLIRLLCRFADPGGGAIRLDGVDLRDLDLDSLRASVGLVTQEVQLVHASIRDNVTLFDDTVSDDRVWAALRAVGLADWCAGTEDGLSTVIGAGAGGLSAGQQQLLAFARIMIDDPRLVVFDEATSRLDPATQSQLAVTADRLLAGRTAVIIAHRLETLRAVDQILVLDGGEVREYGSRAALTADPASAFAGMLATAEVPA